MNTRKLCLYADVHIPLHWQCSQHFTHCTGETISTTALPNKHKHRTEMLQGREGRERKEAQCVGLSLQSGNSGITAVSAVMSLSLAVNKLGHMSQRIKHRPWHKRAAGKRKRTTWPPFALTEIVFWGAVLNWSLWKISVATGNWGEIQFFLNLDLLFRYQQVHEGAKLWLWEEGDAQQSRGEAEIPLNHGCTTAINSWVGIHHLAAPQAEGTGCSQQQWVPIPALCLPHSPLLGPQPAGAGASDEGLAPGNDWNNPNTPTEGGQNSSVSVAF